VKRCAWARNPLAIRYHDREWGVPVRRDRTFFEFLILEGAQAGLSWDTILAKRENYRKAFDGFDPKKISKYSEKKKKALLNNPGIVRNRLKIESAVVNAKCFLALQKEYGSFSAYVWNYVNGKPIRNRHRSMATVPARTEVSDALSKDLKRRGFKFVGTTIMYAFMQATGLVDDHTDDCFRRKK
jgi:DNA-3-methyladenine glycosylase I